MEEEEEEREAAIFEVVRGTVILDWETRRVERVCLSSRSPSMHLRLFPAREKPRYVRHVEEGRKTRRRRRRGEGKKEEEREGKKEERKGRAGRTQYIVGGYLRRKRHEQQIDGRPPGPEWVLRGPPNERHNLPPPPSLRSFLALAISSLSRLIVQARNAPGHRPA